MTDSKARTAPCQSNHQKIEQFLSLDECRQGMHWSEPLRCIQCTLHAFPCSEGSHQTVSTKVLIYQEIPLWQMPKLVHQPHIEKVIVGLWGPDTQWNLQCTGRKQENCPIWRRSLWQLQSWEIEKPGVTSSKFSILIWALWHTEIRIKRMIFCWRNSLGRVTMKTEWFKGTDVANE